MKRIRTVSILLVLVAGTVIGVPSLVIYREMHQMQAARDLIHAVKQQDVSMVKTLLHSGVDANTREVPEPTGTPLERILYLFRHGRPKPVANAYSALMLAVKEDNTPITLALLSAGAKDLNAKISGFGYNENVQCPLLVVAVQHDNIAIVQALLDRGADIEASAENKATPLLTASNMDIPWDQNGGRLADAAQKLARQKQTEMIRLLLERGANVNTTDRAGISALARVGENENCEASLLLLKHGADPNVSDGGWTPLDWAAYNDDLILAKTLVKQGAKVELPGTDSALLAAYRPSMLAFLLDHGANIEARTLASERHGDETVLMEASCAGNFEAVRFLLSRGANVNAVTGDKVDRSTPLRWAAQYADIRVVRYLLNHGARIDLTKDILGCAIEDGHFDVAELLLERGADPNQGALSDTAEWGDEDFAHKLLEKGANVNARDSDGGTALEVAAGDNNVEMVELLLDWGANVNVKDKDGQTPLKLALANDEDHTGEVAALLREVGAKR